MKRWIDRWNAYWFPAATTQPLALARIVMVAAQLFLFFPSLDKHLVLLERNSHFINPQLLIQAIAAIVPRDVLFTPSAFTAIYWITAIAGVLALVGLFTRTSMFVLAAGVWFFVAHEYSYNDRHHAEALSSIFLMALAFSPCGESFSIDALIRRRRDRAAGAANREPVLVDTAMWPLKLAHVLLTLTYLSTGVSKIVGGGGLGWMNGYTLQIYTLGPALNRGFPFGVWIAQHHTLAIVLSVATVVFETFFFISLLVPWTAPFFFVGALFFHTSLYFAAGHDFFQNMVLLVLCLLFLTPGGWRAWSVDLMERFHLGARKDARAYQST